MTSILITDKDSNWQNILASVAENRLNAETVIQSDKERAFRMFYQPFDLVTTEGEVEDFKFIKSLRDYCIKCPILIISTREITLEHARQLGATGAITKDSKLEEIVDMMKVALDYY